MDDDHSFGLYFDFVCRMEVPTCNLQSTHMLFTHERQHCSNIISCEHMGKVTPLFISREHAAGIHVNWRNFTVVGTSDWPD